MYSNSSTKTLNRILYACSAEAIIKKDRLYIYYGAADKLIVIGSIPMDTAYFPGYKSIISPNGSDIIGKALKTGKDSSLKYVYRGNI